MDWSGRYSWNGMVCIFPHWLNMGRSPVWPDLRSLTSKIRDIQLLYIAVLMKLRKFWSCSENKIAAMVTLFLGWDTRFDLVTWPLGTLGQNLWTMCAIVARTAIEKTAERSSAVFALSTKNSREGLNLERIWIYFFSKFCFKVREIGTFSALRSSNITWIFKTLAIEFIWKR